MDIICGTPYIFRDFFTNYQAFPHQCQVLEGKCPVPVVDSTVNVTDPWHQPGKMRERNRESDMV